MNCTVISYKLDPSIGPGPCTVEMLTDHRITEQIRIAGELFTVTGIEPKYSGEAKKVTATCERFPFNKAYDLAPTNTEYELVEVEKL